MVSLLQLKEKETRVTCKEANEQKEKRENGREKEEVKRQLRVLYIVSFSLLKNEHLNRDRSPDERARLSSSLDWTRRRERSMEQRGHCSTSFFPYYLSFFLSFLFLFLTFSSLVRFLPGVSFFPVTLPSSLPPSTFLIPLSSIAFTLFDAGEGTREPTQHVQCFTVDRAHVCLSRIFVSFF